MKQYSLEDSGHPSSEWKLAPRYFGPSILPVPKNTKTTLIRCYRHVTNCTPVNWRSAHWYTRASTLL